MEGAVARARRPMTPCSRPPSGLAAVQRTATLAVAAGNLTQEEATGSTSKPRTRSRLRARTGEGHSPGNPGPAAREGVGACRGAGEPGCSKSAARRGRRTSPRLRGGLPSRRNCGRRAARQAGPPDRIQQRYLAVLAEIGGAQRAGIITTEQAIDARVREAASYQRNPRHHRAHQGSRGGSQSDGDQPAFRHRCGTQRDAAADFPGRCHHRCRQSARPLQPVVCGAAPYLAALAEIKEASKAAS